MASSIIRNRKGRRGKRDAARRIGAVVKTEGRHVRRRIDPTAASLTSPTASSLPRDYPEVLSSIKARIHKERLRAVLTANSAMVLLYWDIGRMILERQQRSGWGAKIIDRLAVDLRHTYPDMKGFSPRNLKYMRAFAAAWTDRAIVQAPLAQITWYHNIALLEKVATEADRLWYARQTIEHGWSQAMLIVKIQSCARQRQGRVVSNFKATLPPTESDMAAHVFKDPYVFDFLGTADPRREREVEQALVDDKPTLGLLLCRSKDRVVVEYALRNLRTPMGVAEWETTIVEKLPKELQASLPTVEEIEAEFDSLQQEPTVIPAGA